MAEPGLQGKLSFFSSRCGLMKRMAGNNGAQPRGRRKKGCIARAVWAIFCNVRCRPGSPCADACSLGHMPSVAGLDTEFVTI